MEQLVVGFVRGSHGLTGNFKVESTSGEYEHFFKMTEVTLRKNGSEQLFKVESVKGSVNNLLMKLTGIDTAEKAKSFSGFEILVSRDKACPCREGEYYVEDLKKCTVVYCAKNGDGLAKTFAPGEVISIGKITDVLEGGANDLFEILISEGVATLLHRTDKERKVLVPFHKEFIGTVDIQNRIIHLKHLWILE